VLFKAENGELGLYTTSWWGPRKEERDPREEVWESSSLGKNGDKQENLSEAWEE